MMNGALSTLRSSFSPLSDRNFRTYLGGQAISLIGTWLQVTAQAWVVWKLTGSNASLGTLTMVNTLPLLFLTPWTGVWADRLDRRKLLIYTQLGAMVLAFILAFLTQTETVQIWHVYVLSFLLGVIAALDFPAQQAFLGDLSGIGAVRKAVNLNITVLQVSRILGPALAGFVIGAVGAATAFWLNGLSFLAVVASLMIVRANQVRSTASGSSKGSFGESVRFVLGQPRIIDVIIFTILVTFFGLSIILNVLPSVADTVLKGDADTLGVLMASSGAGALVGVVLLAPLVQNTRRTGIALCLLLIWMGFWLYLFSLTDNLVVAVITMFLVSIAPPTIITTSNGLLQVLSPPAMRARLLSLFVMVSFGMQPFAALIVGNMADRFGVATAIAVNAIGLVIGGILMMLRPGLRAWKMKTQPSESLVTAPAEVI
ncbi:MAG: MFS transporter [Anaerolineae bacterium]|nr:MFS transporter [Anaerolineae bacterium]